MCTFVYIYTVYNISSRAYKNERIYREQLRSSAPPSDPPGKTEGSGWVAIMTTPRVLHVERADIYTCGVGSVKRTTLKHDIDTSASETNQPVRPEACPVKRKVNGRT